MVVWHCDACRTESGELTSVRSHKSRLWQTLTSALTYLHIQHNFFLGSQLQVADFNDTILANGIL